MLFIVVRKQERSPRRRAFRTREAGRLVWLTRSEPASRSQLANEQDPAAVAGFANVRTARKRDG
jgi:hypothetical protein